MGILESSSSESVNRGYYYYKEGRVLSFEKIEKYKYQGKVKGSGDNVYDVVLDLDKPRTSLCNCPFSKGNMRICKHTIALYFSIYPEEAEDYIDSISAGYDCYEDEDDYYDDYYHFDSYDYVPECYSELINIYLDSLSVEEKNDIIRKELNKDRSYTFHHVLSDIYEEYKRKNGDDYIYLEQLRRKIKDLTNRIDYDYYRWSEVVFNSNEKKKIEKLVKGDGKYSKDFVWELQKPELLIYNNNIWIVKLLDKVLSDSDRERYIKQLTDYFNFLKNYHIRNTMPKSNMLIAIYELGGVDKDKLAFSLLKNYKYSEYVNYVIDRTVDTQKLYDSIIKLVDSNKCGFDKRNIFDLLFAFFEKTDIEKLRMDQLYYDFLFNLNIKSLEKLLESGNKRYLDKLSEFSMNKDQRLAYYAATKQNDLLFRNVINSNNMYLIYTYQKYLEDEYGKEIFSRYKRYIYDVLEEGMGRDIYKKACLVIPYIKKMNEGKQLINELLKELSESKHGKKSALFDVINKTAGVVIKKY